MLGDFMLPFGALSVVANGLSLAVLMPLLDTGEHDKGDQYDHGDTGNPAQRAACSVFALLRLITSAYLVSACTGRPIRSERACS